MTLKDQMEPDEKMLWEGGKSKKVSVLEGIFNPMMVFALIWAFFDFAFVGVFAFGSRMEAQEFGTSELGQGMKFMTPFLLLHMMPVWIYLAGCVTAGMKAKNTYYMITDKNIYVQHGVFSTTTNVKPLTDVLHITVHQGMFDRICGTGDVMCECNHGVYGGSGETTSIANIEDYEQVFRLLKKVQTETFEKQHGKAVQ